ncbi:MAG: anthranilate synthase component I family protein, partial [Flavobacteriales bacterium]|nr:anthranilate synthase component I family protein [Flavobacteriales bacterium]
MSDQTTYNSNVFQKLARFCEGYTHFAFYVTDTSDFSLALGCHRQIELWEERGAFQNLEAFQSQAQTRIAGYLGYDLKNDLEDLRSANPDMLKMPATAFFEPEAWVEYRNGALQITTGNAEIEAEIRAALEAEYSGDETPNSEPDMKPVMTEFDYLIGAEAIKDHLRRGDIYEANFCFQMNGSSDEKSLLNRFLALHSRTKAPFSVYARMGQFEILSASPERFLKNTGGELCSQPIKGTRRRSSDEVMDAALMTELRNDPKEQSENVMIVDLVRNDLSRVAARGSVEVKELFGIQSFNTVHHMVSTICARLNADRYNHWDAIKACFPMGSMTGAPKISAMKIIEERENFKRGPYSGGFGWVDPNGDFDFN